MMDGGQLLGQSTAGIAVVAVLRSDLGESGVKLGLDWHSSSKVAGDKRQHNGCAGMTASISSLCRTVHVLSAFDGSSPGLYFKLATFPLRDTQYTVRMFKSLFRFR
jgi:hypothetical protein